MTVKNLENGPITRKMYVSVSFNLLYVDIGVKTFVMNIL